MLESCIGKLCWKVVLHPCMRLVVKCCWKLLSFRLKVSILISSTVFLLKLFLQSVAKL